MANIDISNSPNQEPVEVLKHLDLRLFSANLSLLTTPSVPGQSAAHLLRKTFLDTYCEAVIFLLFAGSMTEIEFLVFCQADLLIMAWHRPPLELPKAHWRSKGVDVGDKKV